MKRAIVGEPLRNFIDDPLGIYTLMKGPEVIGHFMAMNKKYAYEALNNSGLEGYTLRSFNRDKGKYKEADLDKPVFSSFARLLNYARL